MARHDQAGPPYGAVNARRMMDDVEALAQWVRLSGTEEELEAFKYARKQLRTAGCRTRLILHDAYVSLPGPASLAVLNAAGSADVPCITHSFAASTRSRGVEGRAVYAGQGPVDGTPAPVDQNILILEGLASPAQVRAGQARGASGLVFLNHDPYVHEMIVSTVWGSPTPEALEYLPRIPVVSVAGRDAARVREAVKANDARMRITASVDTGWRKTPILLGDLPGAMEGTFVLFAGHLDSWHRGAMDNGTANATMLEVARLMRPVRRWRGIRFAFWSGHSHGRYSGSTWYADHFWDEMNARCVAHVNVDSVGGRGAVINRHGYAMPETRGVIETVVRALVGGRFEGARVGRMGDQSFLGIGVPSLLMDISEQHGDSPDASGDFSAFSGGRTGGLGWWWHTTEDLPDKIDPALLERDCKIYLGIIHALATTPVVPLDYHATARDWLKRLRALRRGAKRWVDLDPTIAEAGRLVKVTEALGRRARRLGATADRRAVREVNTTLMTLGRLLIPVDYTASGRFGHDVAVTPSGVPLLAAVDALAALPPGDAGGDDARHLAVRAVRDLNAIRFALGQAADRVEVVI